MFHESRQPGGVRSRALGGPREARGARHMVTLVCIVYLVVLAALAGYGLHRVALVALAWRHRARIGAAAVVEVASSPDGLPFVTVQLPIFNESTCASRLVRAVGALDYPRDKLQIQVLDDSTDETAEITRTEVAALLRAGTDAVWLHRCDRTGFKAGALAAGLAVAKGELVALFDADFLPPPDFLRAVVGHFCDPGVGMVQARWTHLNRDASLLTRVQALMLDGHHLVENRARYGAGLMFNFSGTAGVWRRSAIDDAGGWQHDTLTEDLDLSYRAQLQGWRFVYREDVCAPAEVPEAIAAVRAQQRRWAKGTTQTARKILPRVFAAKVSWAQKLESVFHLTPHFAYPLMIALSFLLLPLVILFRGGGLDSLVLVDLPVCLVPLSSLATYYMAAEVAQGRTRRGALRLMPAVIAIGAGLAPHLARAVFQGLRERGGEFVRTPKRGLGAARYRTRSPFPAAELTMAAVSCASTIVAAAHAHWFATPFAALSCAGSFYVAVLMLKERSRAPMRVAAPEREASSTRPGARAGADRVTDLAA